MVASEVLADLLDRQRLHERCHDGVFRPGCRYCRYRQEYGGTGVPVFRMVDARGRSFLETDDWVMAEYQWMAALGRYDARYILGTHPTHDWDRGAYPHKCRNCPATANGCFASHAPCGYEIRGRALVTVITDELRARRQERSGAGG